MNDQHRMKLQHLFEAQRAAFHDEMFPVLKTRLDRLERLLQMTERNQHHIAQAISADFGSRSVHETRMAEIEFVVLDIRHTRNHLKHWMKTKRLHTALQYRPGSNRLIRQPLGVVGIVAPWNYPYQLAIAPAVGAIAAGNRVMIKPSDLTPRLSALLAELVATQFKPAELAIVNGDADVARAFVDLPFDHLLFTGSTAVGREVAMAAAKNLTPVTLELGGKSPVIIDESCDLKAAAARLAFGKLLNAGQTCIAPDYLLLHRRHAAAMPELMREAVNRLYPSIGNNPDYTSIVTQRHHERLQALLGDARQHGGTVITIVPPEDNVGPVGRKMPLSLVFDATPAMRVMQEEIFGPILPVVTFDRLDDALADINRRERPLALYWFGTNTENRNKVLHGTLSGGVTINDCIWHISQASQPFGGVGASGNGAYHGEWGFQTFSKEKPVFIQSRFSGLSMIYPPYGKRFERIMAIARRLA